jgi:hypothetical protein
VIDSNTLILITLRWRECLLFYVGARHRFGHLGSFRETSLGLLKIDDVPNRAEVLRERVNELL